MRHTLCVAVTCFMASVVWNIQGIAQDRPAPAGPRGVRMPETFSVPTDRDQSVRVSDDLPLGSRGGTALRYYFPADGEYLFELRPKESGAGGGFEGITAEPHQLEIAIDGVKMTGATLGGPEFVRRDPP